MVAAKITHTRLALSELAGCIPEDAWLLVKRAQAELDCAAHMAERLETSFFHMPSIAPRIVRPLRQQPESSAASRLRFVINNTQKGENHV